MRLGIVTDAHLCPPGTPPDGCHNPYAYDRAASMLSKALEDHRADGIDALAVLGDMTNGGDSASLVQAVALLASVDVPVVILAGNHDRDHDPNQLTELARSSSNDMRMANPRGETVAGIHIAGLPITGEEPDGWRVEQPCLTGWPDAPTILLCHLPVVSRELALGAAGFKYAGGLVNGDAVVQELIDRRAPTVVVHGHLHMRDACVVGPVLQIGCAALIEPPHERTVIDANERDGALTVRVSHLPVAASPNVRLPVMSPSEATWLFRLGEWTMSSGSGV
jgi:Icc-related predicted phosphoesterase